MQQSLENNNYIKEIIELNKKHKDRYIFHKEAQKIIEQIANDNPTMDLIVQQNFNDLEYQNQIWTLYNIPYLKIYEHPDFVLKIHVFAPLQTKESGIGASCIHHHNNFLLSSYAMHGSGY